MTTLRLGATVTFEDDGGHFRKGQVWALHQDNDTYWIACEGRMYARKRSVLSSMQHSHQQLELV